MTGGYGIEGTWGGCHSESRLFDGLAPSLATLAQVSRGMSNTRRSESNSYEYLDELIYYGEVVDVTKPSCTGVQEANAYAVTPPGRVDYSENRSRDTKTYITVHGYTI